MHAPASSVTSWPSRDRCSIERTTPWTRFSVNFGRRALTAKMLPEHRTVPDMPVTWGGAGAQSICSDNIRTRRESSMATWPLARSGAPYSIHYALPCVCPLTGHVEPVGQRRRGAVLVIPPDSFSPPRVLVITTLSTSPWPTLGKSSWSGTCKLVCYFAADNPASTSFASPQRTERSRMTTRSRSRSQVSCSAWLSADVQSSVSESRSVWTPIRTRTRLLTRSSPRRC